MSVQPSIYRVQFRPPLWLVKHTSLSCSQQLQQPILATCSRCPYLPPAPAVKYMLWPWNTKAAIASWKDYMKEIYRHMDSDYDGSLMVDLLLRFHRNLYQHYIHVNCRKRGGVMVTIEEVVADARSDVLHMIPFPTVDQAYAYVHREDVRQAVMMGSSVPTSISLAAKSAPRSGPPTRVGHPHNSSTAAHLQI
ncbi:unnamed protein product [Prunus armeniaca]